MATGPSNPSTKNFARRAISSQQARYITMFADDRVTQGEIIVVTHVITLISRYVTPELISRISFAFGFDKSLARKAVDAAIPILVEALVRASATQEGSQKLHSAILRQKPIRLDMVARTIGRSRQGALVDENYLEMSSVLGPSAASRLGYELAKYVEIGESASSSLLAIMWLYVMGVLAEQVGSKTLDFSGLFRLLSAQ
jgi:hypothetical protein